MLFLFVLLLMVHLILNCSITLNWCSRVDWVIADDWVDFKMYGVFVCKCMRAKALHFRANLNLGQWT